jgi:hypothetical protein
MCWPSSNLLNPRSEEFASVASVARGSRVEGDLLRFHAGGQRPTKYKPPPHRCLQGEPLGFADGQ